MGSAAEYESGACYVLDGEVGDNPEAFSQPYDRTAEREFLVICHSRPALANVRATGPDGQLRLAPRRSEHVDCAAGQQVLAAGEVLFAREGATWSVSEISNQSTGYCPDPDSWPAVASALDRIGLAHPGDFTHKMVFRRCPACGQLNIVRDGSFACSACDSPLPAHWNISLA